MILEVVFVVAFIDFPVDMAGGTESDDVGGNILRNHAARPNNHIASNLLVIEKQATSESSSGIQAVASMLR